MDNVTFKSIFIILMLVSKVIVVKMTVGVIENLGVFKSAIEQLEASVIITDTDGVIVYVNPFFTNHTGFTFDEVHGKSPGIINSGKQPTGFYEHLWATINAGNTWNGELQNKRKNGELYWERVSISPIRDNVGVVTHFIAVYQDISKQKATEQELARKERLMNIVEEINQTGGWEYDIIKEEIYWTDELYMIHGFKKDNDIDFITESLKCYHPEDAVKLESAFNHIIATGKGYDLTARFIDANNTTKWLRTKTEAIRSVSGGISKIVGSVKDVTEFVEREKELMESEKRYRALFEDSSDANLLEKDGIIIDCNQSTVALLGYDNKDEVIGKSIEEVSPKKVGDLTTVDLFKKIQEAFKKGPHVRFEWERIRKDKSIVPVEVMLTNLNQADLENTRYVVWRDISKRKAAEQALVQSNEERGLLLAEIHHRVKNNLAIISGLVQLQMFKSKKKHDVQLLSKTVNRIRTIALIHEQLYLSDDFAQIPIAQNIKKQIDYIQSMYQSDVTVIHTKLDLDDVYVSIDLAIPVGLLLNEILNNAYKYAFPNRDEGTISISLKETNNKTVCLMIKDDGVGMNEEDYNEVPTLGRSLIENLLVQMEADVTISMRDGVEYNIVFKQSEKLS